jgi:Raf kinase inhibitor-like YbhB/YbcL family protein
MPFTLESQVFPSAGRIPKNFTCEGANHSPALIWSGQPAKTKSFALILDDPDAPGGVWNHWLLWNIPATISELQEDMRPYGAIRTGTNDFRMLGYRGPCPPKGHGAHRYYFRLFALDVETLNVPAGASRPELEQALTEHVLARAEYMGHFERATQ